MHGHGWGNNSNIPNISMNSHVKLKWFPQRHARIEWWEPLNTQRSQEFTVRNPNLEDITH